MSNEQEKRQAIDHKRDASDSQKSVTSQKTADEAVSAETQAKRHSENFESLSHDTKALGQYAKAEQPLVLHDSTTGELIYDASKRRATAERKSAGDRIVEMERGLLAHKQVTTSPERPLSAGEQIIRMQRAQLSEKLVTDDRTSLQDTARGDRYEPVKQEINLWIPDYKSAASPSLLPKLVEVRITPEDNQRIDELFRKSLENEGAKRDESKISDFEKQNLKTLAFCDVALEKYQDALSRNTLRETRHMPEQVRGLMLAGAALEDGAAIGATRAVLHKVIEDGAFGELASGTAIGIAFGKVVGTLAMNVHPVTRYGARALQAGGLALAVKEIGQLGVDGYNGFMQALPSLQDCCSHPNEKNFARAKASVEGHLGNPLADSALLGLGFAAARGVEKVATRSGGKGVTRGRSGDNAEEARVHSHEESFERPKHKDVQELPKVAHTEYSCETKFEDRYRILKSGDEKTMLRKSGEWFSSVKNHESDTHSPIKVHVLVDSPLDLARVQKVLIPKLINDPELRAHVGQWKGQDPEYSLSGRGHPETQAPTGVGQGAKGFTIYSRNATDAWMVQKRIDHILHEAGLSLKSEIKTGNSESCPGLSKRTSICRDTFAQGQSAEGALGPCFDEAVAFRINQHYDLRAGERLSTSNLRDLEQRTGLKENLLTYSSTGHLMIKGQGGISGYHGGYYATESGISTAAGHLVERPAMYAVYRAFGVDPCDLNVVWKK